MSDLDQFDVAILRCLQDNNRMTTEAIGTAVGLSPTACQRRIKRLRETGAIAAEIAVLDPDRVGGRMTLILQVTLRRGGAHLVDAFRRDIVKVPEVQQCYYVTGDYDFVLIVTAKDMADYERLIRRAFFDDPNIQRFHTAVVMDTVKRGLAMPL